MVKIQYRQINNNYINDFLEEDNEIIYYNDKNIKNKK
jgi:hypothetical protein